MRENIVEILVEVGYSVRAGSTGAEAQEKYEAEPANLVITNIFMRIWTGSSSFALSLIQARISALWRCRAMSGDVDYLEIANALGAAQTLRKPFRKMTILNTVETCYRKHHVPRRISGLPTKLTLVCYNPFRLVASMNQFPINRRSVLSMKNAYQEVMDIRGKGLPADDEITISGADPVFSTEFKIGETCAAVLGGIGIAVSDIWELKTGHRQMTSVNVRHAAGALRSTNYLQEPGPDGAFKALDFDEHNDMRRITQPWPTKDGRWFLPHFGLPNLRERVLGVWVANPIRNPSRKPSVNGTQWT